MKILYRTKRQRELDRNRHNKEWQPCFLFWPRRAHNNDRTALQYLAFGRCARKRVSRDGDGMMPYIWIYMDRNDAVADKLIGKGNERNR